MGAHIVSFLSEMLSGFAQIRGTTNIDQQEANTSWSDNCSLGVAAGAFLLLGGGGRKVAQLGLVLVLPHQVQLCRVAVLVAESLQTKLGNIFSPPAASPAGSSLQAPPRPQPSSRLGSPRPSPSHPPGRCRSPTKPISQIPKYLALEVGAQWLLARGFGVNLDVKAEVHLLLILWLQLQLHFDLLLLLLKVHLLLC